LSPSHDHVVSWPDERYALFVAPAVDSMRRMTHFGLSALVELARMSISAWARRVVWAASRLAGEENDVRLRLGPRRRRQVKWTDLREGL
jgi:hypothetical protein